MASAPNRWWGSSGNLWTNAKRVAGAVIIYNVGSSFYQTYKIFKEYVTLPEAFYLELDLEQQVLVDRLSSNPISLITSGLHQMELQGLIQALHTAKTDGRVRGLMAILGGRENFAGVAQLQELRNALLDFRFHAQGRAPMFAYSNTFGEGGMNATGLYYLASAADKVFMPPTSCLSLLGFESTQVFVRGLLDKLKVEPEVFRREEYKAAAAPLTEKGFDPAHRENITSLLQCLYDQVVQGIAAARRLSPEDVESAISAAPLLPSMAMQMKLLDGLMYRDQVEQLLLKRLPADVQSAVHQARSTPPGPRGQPPTVMQLAGPRVPLHRYTTATAWAKQSAQLWGSSSSSKSLVSMPIPQHPTPPDRPASIPGSSSSVDQQQAAAAADPVGPQSLQQKLLQQRLAGMQRTNAHKPWVAVVTAAGPIVQTSTGGGAPSGGDVMVESHKLVRALRSIRENPQFKAVVLRINSPGGSAVASDIIAREVTLLRESGKPVVACMGDVAASGGYYIAAPANKILAQPGTITGSIGVILAKFKAKAALEEFGVTSDTIQLGENANWASPFHTLTPKQQQQVESLMDATYDNFLSEVARGRSLSKETVRQVAKGRVWSGSQAVEVGLVDELGGVTRAVDLAKQLAGLPEDPAATETLEWPPRRIPPWMMLARSTAMPGSSDQPAAATAYPLLACAAGSLTAAASLARTFIYICFHLHMSGCLLEGDHDCQGTVLQQLATATGGLQQQQCQKIIGKQIDVAAVGSGMAAGAAQAAARIVGLLVAEGAAGSTRPMLVPDMLCLEADMLAYSC